MGITVDKNLLAGKKNNLSTKIVNAYIVYDLDAWPKILSNNFNLKNCLFGATDIVKNGEKEKRVYSGYGKVFDGAGLWNFGNDNARNVVIFGADNS